MISDCSYCGILELDERAFFIDSVALLTVVVPAAICYTLWRIFITNRTGPRGGIVVLGLDDSSSIYSGSLDMQPSGDMSVLYIATAVLTFLLGILAFEVWKDLRELLSFLE